MGRPPPPGLIATIVAIQPATGRSVSAWLILAMVPVGGGMGNALGAVIGTIFFGQLGSSTSPAAYGNAFSISLALQAAFGLAAAALV